MLTQKDERFLFPPSGLTACYYLILIGAWLSLACSSLAANDTPPAATNASDYWDLQAYTVFLEQNIEYTNKKYGKEYISYEFIVDTEYGSTPIQDLIDPEAVAPIIDHLELENLNGNQKLFKIYEYVLQNYSFVLDPYNWPTVEETIKRKMGDCNSLSLLLMSLFRAAGIDTYAGISNGHMWVYAMNRDTWELLELDQDPERIKLYSLPGFYNDPVYRIYDDHSEKRKSLRAS